MANFSTHMVGAAATGVVATSILAATDLLPVPSVAAGIGMVALGGIFPDVDSDHSDAIELVFGLLGITLGVPVMTAVLPHFGLLAALGALGLTYVLMRYGLIRLMQTVTVHRGVFHSIPMAIAVTCLVAIVATVGMHQSTTQAWVFAGLFLIGFLTHLTLDEMYAVDLMNRKLKRSFGSALKVFEKERLVRYLTLYVAMFTAMAFAPSPIELIHELGQLELRLLPQRETVTALLALLS